MSGRQAYHGLQRKLVLAFDVGTTFSGVSFALLDPGLTPEIQGVTRFPAQQKVGGDSKIPSIIYYDREGNVRAVGAEATQEAFLEQAEEEELIRVEWFKLHLRPKSLSATHITDEDVPPLPTNKTAITIFADFLQYLYQCARSYIEDTLPSGSSIWRSVEEHIQFIISHPNGWEGGQQAQMRRAAIIAGLIPNDESQERVQFVTEGEASLHFCINKGITTDTLAGGRGVIIADAGGGTVDLSAYCKTSGSGAFEEIAQTQCRLQGAIFVSRRARAYLADRLKDSRYGNPEDVNHMTEVFDKSTKLSFRNSSDPSFIRFGGARERDLRVDIKSGQMKLPGETVASFFEPSIQEIFDAITEQRTEATKTVSIVFLVGGFAASDWLFTKLQQKLQPLGITLFRPDGHVNKAVADGAVSFYLDHFVSVRVANYTYGVECATVYDSRNPEHLSRSHTVIQRPSGRRLVPNCFSAILNRGTRVREETEFREVYTSESVIQNTFNTISTDILCYRNQRGSVPEWTDVNPNMFSSLCTVIADTSQIGRTLRPQRGLMGIPFYSREFSIVLLFGLTELKAQLCWMEDGEEKRSQTAIVYDETNELQ